MANQKPALAAWIVSNRKRLGWKLETLAAKLREAGYEAADTTVRTWEAGRRPQPDTIVALERLFDSTAPSADETAPDLIVALQEQTAAMRELTAAISALLASGISAPAVRRVAESEAEYWAERSIGESRAAALVEELRTPAAPGSHARRSVRPATAESDQ